MLHIKAPAKVGENIDRFLTAIDASSPKKWNAYIGAGYMYDTNATAISNQLKATRYRVIGDKPDKVYLSDHNAVFVNLEYTK